jgi:hypothetical protein
MGGEHPTIWEPLVYEKVCTQCFRLFSHGDIFLETFIEGRYGLDINKERR